MIIRETITLSPYTVYEKAYDYVLNDASIDLNLYALVECRNEMIDLGDEKFISRKQIGIAAVCIDLFIMMVFLLSIWIITYFVKLDSDRHNNLLFETKEFSVAIKNLPTLDKEYTIEQMKTELWDHLITILSEQPQQIQRLRNSEESRACEIIDIQFAMSDYHYLEDVLGIKQISQAIEVLDMKLDECQDGVDDDKIVDYNMKRQTLLRQQEDLQNKYFSSMEQMGLNNQAV